MALIVAARGGFKLDICGFGLLFFVLLLAWLSRRAHTPSD
jgi:hypothetical protein